MINKVNLYIKKHLASNIGVYALVLFFFLIGISLGAISINSVSLEMKNQVISYIEGFLKLASNENFDSSLVLKQSIKLNLYSIIIIYLSGFLSLGVIIIPAYLIFRGYCLGFTIGFLAQNLGSNGFILSLVSILPQSTIYVPLIMVISVIGISQSICKIRNRVVKKMDQSKIQALSYSISIVFLTLALIFGSLIESYITPVLVRIATPYLI